MLPIPFIYYIESISPTASYIFGEFVSYGGTNNLSRVMYSETGGIGKTNSYPVRMGGVAWSPVDLTYNVFEYAASSPSLYKTYNDGYTYTITTANNPPLQIDNILYFTQSSKFYACCSLSVLKISDDAITWATSSNTTTTRTRDGIAVGSTSSYLITICGNGLVSATSAVVGCYSTNSTNWSNSTIVTVGYGGVATYTGIAYSPTLNRYVQSGSNQGYIPPYIYGIIYSNNGITYSGVNNGIWPARKCVEWSPTLSKFFCVDDSSIDISSDGITWTTYSIGFTTGGVNYIKWSSLKNKLLLGCFNGIYESSDGLSWTAVISGIDAYRLAFSTTSQRNPSSTNYVINMAYSNQNIPAFTGTTYSRVINDYWKLRVTTTDQSYQFAPLDKIWMQFGTSSTNNALDNLIGSRWAISGGTGTYSFEISDYDTLGNIDGTTQTSPSVISYFAWNISGSTQSYISVSREQRVDDPFYGTNRLTTVSWVLNGTTVKTVGYPTVPLSNVLNVKVIWNNITKLSYVYCSSDTYGISTSTNYNTLIGTYSMNLSDSPFCFTGYFPNQSGGYGKSISCNSQTQIISNYQVRGLTGSNAGVNAPPPTNILLGQYDRY